MSNFNSIPVVSKASFKGEFDFCNAGDLLKNNGHAKHVFFALPKAEGTPVTVTYENGVSCGVSQSSVPLSKVPKIITGFTGTLECVLMGDKVLPLYTGSGPMVHKDLVTQLKWFSSRGVKPDTRIVSPATMYQQNVWKDVNFLKRGYDHRSLNANQRDWVTMEPDEFDRRRERLSSMIQVMQSTATDMLKQSGTGAVLVMTSSPESQRRFSEDPGKSSAVIVTA